MADPLAIAGLAIAVLDDLIELSVWTYNIIQDARAFDHDTRRLQTLIASDTSRSQLLKSLLFAKASAYGGRTLFDQFERDVQEQTLQLLEECKATLKAGQDLLERRYGLEKQDKGSCTPPRTPSALSTASTLVPAASTNGLTRSKSNPSLSIVLMWSVRDKKRVESLIQTFNEQNQRLQDNVKLWCLANQLGVDPGHLQRLESDESSQKLGFDVDARLRLLRRNPPGDETSLELPKEPWADLLSASAKAPHASAFHTVNKDGKLYIQENHDYEIPGWWTAQCNGRASSVDPTTKRRVEALARLLHQPKEQIFRIPHCLGWRYVHHQSQSQFVSFVFAASHPPVSLLELLSSNPREEGANPELGDKFRLAAGLATCLAQLHMVGWLHESLRSENVLFFPGSGAMAATRDVDFASPSVLGFDFSRDDVSRSTFRADFEPSRDVYRHPQRQGEPEKAFTKLHDIYALGVILLEIGLWKPAVSLQKDNFKQATFHDRYDVSKQLLQHAEHRLERRVGRKYKDVVVKCLKGDFGVTDDNREDLKLQQAFRSQVVEVFERAADAV